MNNMFPVSSGADADEGEGHPVLFTSLLFVFLILTVLIFGLWAVQSFMWKILFGAHFELGNYGALAPLLILYAITTGIYSLGSVIITYEMSRKIANTSWVQLAFSGALALGIYILHQTLRQVILVQFVLMIALLFVLMIPLLRRQFTPRALPIYGESETPPSNDRRGSDGRISEERISSLGIRRVSAGIRRSRQEPKSQQLPGKRPAAGFAVSQARCDVA